MGNWVESVVEVNKCSEEGTGGSDGASGRGVKEGRGQPFSSYRAASIFYHGRPVGPEEEGGVGPSFQRSVASLRASRKQALDRGCEGGATTSAPDGHVPPPTARGSSSVELLSASSSSSSSSPIMGRGEEGGCETEGKGMHPRCADTFICARVMGAAAVSRGNDLCGRLASEWAKNELNSQ